MQDMQDFAITVEAACQMSNPLFSMTQIMVEMLTHSNGRLSGDTETGDSKEIAILCARIADAKKAEDILIFDVRRLTFITDFFVICNGSNKRQLQSIAGEIELRLHSHGIHGVGIEGYTDGRWILMDYGNVVIHLFDREMRLFYDLELLWGDAPKLLWKPD